MALQGGTPMGGTEDGRSGLTRKGVMRWNSENLVIAWPRAVGKWEIKFSFTEIPCWRMSRLVRQCETERAGEINSGWNVIIPDNI